MTHMFFSAVCTLCIEYLAYLQAYICQNMQKHDRASTVRLCIPESNALDLTFIFQCDKRTKSNINHDVTFLV